jgi:hypothetical protein
VLEGHWVNFARACHNHKPCRSLCDDAGDGDDKSNTGNNDNSNTIVSEKIAPLNILGPNLKKEKIFGGPI